MIESIKPLRVRELGDMAQGARVIFAQTPGPEFGFLAPT